MIHKEQKSMKLRYRGFLALILLLAAGCVTSGRRGEQHWGGPAGWTRLGSAEANFNVDTDRIDVGESYGSFREIMIVVDGAPLEMRDVLVTFRDGTHFSPDLRERFEEGSRSRNIDLPRDKRVIRRIDFKYRSLDRRAGKAIVTVYGR
jgi:hypothetical protein